LKSLGISNYWALWFAFAKGCIIGGASSIQGILNDKYLTKYSDKVKNGIIVFIATTTIGILFFNFIPPHLSINTT